MGRPVGIRMMKLQGAASKSAADLAQLASLGRRAALSSRVSAVLLGLAVLSMAVFRYAPALAG